MFADFVGQLSVKDSKKAEAEARLTENSTQNPRSRFPWVIFNFQREIDVLISVRGGAHLLS